MLMSRRSSTVSFLQTNIPGGDLHSSFHRDLLTASFRRDLSIVERDSEEDGSSSDDLTSLLHIDTPGGDLHSSFHGDIFQSSRHRDLLPPSFHRDPSIVREDDDENVATERELVESECSSSSEELLSSYSDLLPASFHRDPSIVREDDDENVATEKELVERYYDECSSSSEELSSSDSAMYSPRQDFPRIGGFDQETKNNCTNQILVRRYERRAISTKRLLNEPSITLHFNNSSLESSSISPPSATSTSAARFADKLLYDVRLPSLQLQEIKRNLTVMKIKCYQLRCVQIFNKTKIYYNKFNVEEEARVKVEAARLQAEEEARVAAQEEAKAIAAAAEAERIKVEEEARVKAEEEATRLQAEEEARVAAEIARAAAIEAERVKVEEEARVKVEAARLQAEEEARVAAQEEAKAIAAAIEAERIKVVEKARVKNSSITSAMHAFTNKNRTPPVLHHQNTRFKNTKVIRR